jgi:hypothetical protein
VVPCQVSHGTAKNITNQCKSVASCDARSQYEKGSSSPHGSGQGGLNGNIDGATITDQCDCAGFQQSCELTCREHPGEDNTVTPPLPTATPPRAASSADRLPNPGTSVDFK